jgi:hypothetical protein
VERISHFTCPTIDVQHGVFLHESWQSPLVATATRAHELNGTTIVGGNEAVRQNFPEHVRDKVVIIPNGSDPGRVYPLVDRNELRATLGLTSAHKVVVYIGRIPTTVSAAQLPAPGQIARVRQRLYLVERRLPTGRLREEGGGLFFGPPT